MATRKSARTAKPVTVRPLVRAYGMVIGAPAYVVREVESKCGQGVVWIGDKITGKITYEDIHRQTPIFAQALWAFTKNGNMDLAVE